MDKEDLKRHVKGSISKGRDEYVATGVLGGLLGTKGERAKSVGRDVGTLVLDKANSGVQSYLDKRKAKGINSKRDDRMDKHGDRGAKAGTLAGLAYSIHKGKKELDKSKGDFHKSIKGKGKLGIAGRYAMRGLGAGASIVTGKPPLDLSSSFLPL